MARQIVDQEFVAHLFFFDHGPGANEAYDRARRLWAACRNELGMSGPVPGLGVADLLPKRKENLPRGAVLAAQQRSGSRDRQCILRRVGEVLNLSAMLIQPRPESSGARRLQRSGALQSRSRHLGWVEFSQLWSRAAGANGGVALGEATLLLARTQNKWTRPGENVLARGESLASLLPYDEARTPEWWQDGLVSPQGFAVWDTRPPHASATRELVVIAPPNSDRSLSSWVWSDGTADLPPLAEYLLHCFLLRHQAQVLDGWQSAPRLTDVAAVLEEVAGTFGQATTSGSAQNAERSGLLRAHLDRLQASEFRLGTLAERLRRMADHANDLVGKLIDTWGSPEAFQGDLALARWLSAEVTSEYMDQYSLLTRTVRARRLVADELDRSLRASDAEPSARQRVHPVASTEDISRKVFVVHGRDDEAKETFFSFLQALDLRPQDWELLVNATGGTSPNIVDVVRRAPEIAQATVVLMTPDDGVQLHPDLASEHDPDFETELGSQARPNVILELGMALMAYRERTIVIEIGSLRPIGDLAGLNVIRFDGSGRSIAKVIQRLRAAGCPVDDTDTSWKDPARFAGLGGLTRRPDDLCN